MKKIILPFIFVTILLLLGSCEKDLLEKYPHDKLSSETFWETEEDLETGLAGVYNVMVNRGAMNFGRCLWDGLSDIGYGYGSINQGLIEPTSGGLITSIYNQCYEGISRCNIFLENSEKVDVSDQIKMKYQADVYLLRAHFYFTLTEFYGGVPLYTEPPTIEEAIVPKSTKQTVVDQILSDLDVAIANLPDEKYSGRAVKASALALKAKVLMHQERWEEAANMAYQIISSKKFSLYDDFKNLFLKYGQDDNPEILFSVRYLLPDNGNFAGNGSPEHLWAHSHALSPIDRYVESFQCTDGLPISESPLYDENDIYKNRDPRLFETVIDFERYREKGEPIGQTGETWQTDWSIEKMVDWNTMPVSWAQQSEQDYILLRYAQVLLIYAECRNEASGPDQSVYDAVNEVRTRPSVDMPPLPEGLDQSAMRESIRNERKWELGMEGLRYWDIKRWKTIETVLPTILDPSGLYRKFDPTKHYLWPFSVREMDTNPLLDQNPGYD